jgi:SPP1 family predicted phage head-tail adaptor
MPSNNVLSRKLDRYICIQKKKQIRNKNAALGDVWSVYKNTWASIDWNRGNTQWDGTLQSTVNFLTFETRYDDGINSKMRIVYNDKIYEIQNVQEIGRKGGLRITTINFDG